MLNRAKRNRALDRLPVARALRSLLVRDSQAEHPRVQLVAASATLSRRIVR